MSSEPKKATPLFTPEKLQGWIIYNLMLGGAMFFYIVFQVSVMGHELSFGVPTTQASGRR